jgi:hypothetical protein
VRMDSLHLCIIGTFGPRQAKSYQVLVLFPMQKQGKLFLYMEVFLQASSNRFQHGRALCNCASLVHSSIAMCIGRSPVPRSVLKVYCNPLEA